MTNTIERNQDKLKLCLRKYELLSAIPEADRTMSELNALLELNGEIGKIEERVRKQIAKSAITEAEVEEAKRAASGSMADFIHANDINFTAETNDWWWHQGGEWHAANPRGFNEKFRGYIGDHEAYQLFQSILDHEGRKKNKPYYGWTHRVGDLNLLSVQKFCPSIKGAKDYHPIFDLLLQSLSGNKKENKEHLEKLIVGKYLHPDNHLLPCIVFADNGGTGKSVFVERFICTVFAANNVAKNCAMENVFGKFNKIIAGKVIVFANEAVDDEKHTKGILRVLRSPTINIEGKGKDIIEAANTPLYFIGTNPKHDGYAIKLAFNDTDRRFSIIHGTRPLKWYVAEHYALSHANDDEAGDIKMMDELQDILVDPYEVGCWLHCKLEEHGDIKNLAALHGKDYEQQAEDTEDMYLRVCNAVFNEAEFQYIRCDVLYQLYKANSGKFGPISFTRMVKKYLSEKHPYVQHSERRQWLSEHNCFRKQANLYARVDAHQPAKGFKDNDDHYVREEVGRYVPMIDVI